MVLKKEKTLGDPLFFTSLESIRFFEEIKQIWVKILTGKERIIFVPCASSKPIQISQTHSYLSPITRVFDQKTLVVIVSEPLTLIPYLYYNYPNYDYLPKNLKGKEKEIFIQNLKTFREITPKSIKCYYLGGKHHYNLLISAGFQITYYHPPRGTIDYYKTAVKMAEDLHISGPKIQFRYELIKGNVGEQVKIKYSIH